MKDPYKTLGVSKSASDEEIKKAYKKLAIKYHPDRNPDNPSAEEQFKEVSSAYSLLTNPDQRKKYDTYGSVDPGDIPKRNPYVDFEEILRGFAGDGFGFGRTRRQARGEDIQQAISIDFLEAAHGCEKKIAAEYPYNCTDCRRTGAKDGTALQQCSACGGQGKIGRNEGFMNILTTCPACAGKGNIIIDKCEKCDGKGVRFKKEVLKIKIPAGVNQGTAMKLAGKGMPSAYGAPGDMYLRIMIKAHPQFKRDGNNVYTELKVNYINAILGDKVKIETIHGPVDLKIPAGTQPQQLLKIAKKGINKQGDHMVRVQIEIPKKVTDAEKALLLGLKDIQK